MKNILMILLLAVYGVFGLQDSHADVHHRNRWRKPVLMPLLLAFYLLRTDKISILLVLALLFAWAGDTFLLKRNHAGMVIGASSFFAGHLCYMFLFGRDIRDLNVFLLLLSLILYACSVLYCLRKVLPQAKPSDKPLISIYMTGIHGMSLLAFLRMFSGPLTPGVFLVWAGTVCFLISDTFIAFRYVGLRDSKGVMETYLAAQLLIVLGFLIA